MQAWLYLHWLSLDVAIGAGVSAAWVNHSWGGEHSWWATIALCAGALWVYSVDHWADALRAAQRPPELLSPRRLFYVNARHILIILSAISTALGIWASLYLPWSALGFGAMFILTCGAYLWITQKRQDSHEPLRYPKEAIVTTLYALALTAWPLSQSFNAPKDFSPLFGSLTSLLVLALAWANVCLISAHERRADAAEGSPSLALWLGEYTTRNIGRGVLKVAIGLWFMRFYIAFSSSLPSSPDSLTSDSLNRYLDPLIAGLMIFTLWRLYSRPEWSAIRSRYRRWSDAVFIFPVCLYILNIL